MYHQYLVTARDAIAKLSFLNWKKLLICLTVLSMILGGCNLPGFDNSILWKNYINSRYGFEFPYPENWESLPPPDNDDGVVIVFPKNKSVSIQGWAGNRFSVPVSRDKTYQRKVDKNFQTLQGIPGILSVEVGNKNSYMTLNIVEGKLNYYWQGRSPSKEFQNYYRLFEYIAKRYKINQ